MTIDIILDKGAMMPERAHEDDAGLDLFCPQDTEVPPGSSAVIDTGVHVNIPKGYVGMIKSKSGLNTRHDLTTEGVIDAGYTGSIKVKVYNHHVWHWYRFEKGDKLTQLVIMPIVTPAVKLVEMFPDSERGDNGFGSSGK